jgi:hypothetical protein
VSSPGPFAPSCDATVPNAVTDGDRRLRALPTPERMHPVVSSLGHGRLWLASPYTAWSFLRCVAEHS